MTQANVLAASGSAGVSLGFKNRIINGAMTIDQRNAGASVTNTVSNTYVLDRWNYGASQASKFTVQQNAGSVTPPTGFSNYLGFTSLSAYTLGAGDYFYTSQNIEGFNFSDMAWGTTNAKTVTLSFWVRSSLTGTFGGALQNSANSRSYPFSYSVPVANTWTQISVTIAGDTTGTWIGSTNGVGLRVFFSIGTGTTYSGTAGTWAATNYISATGATSVVGTNGATWYLTGVQLEVGASATNFEVRDYSTELILCQRYYETSYGTGVAVGTVTQNGAVLLLSTPSGFPLTGGYPTAVTYLVSKRTAPTMVNYSTNTGTAARVYTDNPAGDTVTSAISRQSTTGFFAYTGSNIVNTGGFIFFQWTASAEL